MLYRWAIPLGREVVRRIWKFILGYISHNYYYMAYMALWLADSMVVLENIGPKWSCNTDRAHQAKKKNERGPAFPSKAWISQANTEISPSSQMAKICNNHLPSNKHPFPSPCFMEECRDNRGCVVLVVLNHKQVIIDSFNMYNCTLTVATDGSEDLLIHCLEPNQTCAAGLDRLIGYIT